MHSAEHMWAIRFPALPDLQGWLCETEVPTCYKRPRFVCSFHMADSVTSSPGFEVPFRWCRQKKLLGTAGVLQISQEETRVRGSCCFTPRNRVEIHERVVEPSYSSLWFPPKLTERLLYLSDLRFPEPIYCGSLHSSWRQSQMCTPTDW